MTLQALEKKMDVVRKEHLTSEPPLKPDHLILANGLLLRLLSFSTSLENYGIFHFSLAVNAWQPLPLIFQTS